MYHHFQALASAHAGVPAVIESESGRVVTRKELLMESEILAGELLGRGIAVGDRVALQLPNSASFVAAVLAASKLGVALVPFDRDAPECEVGTILQQFAVRALFSARDGGIVMLQPPASRVPLPPTTRILKLTSGSTGAPRAVACSEKNLMADSATICETMGIQTGDVNLGAIPFSHSYGFSNLVMPLITQGTAVVSSNDYLPLSLLDVANRFGCTVAPLIPMVYEHLGALPQDDGGFLSVKTFISAGAPLASTASTRFRERFRTAIHSFYGCSECGGISYDRTGSAAERGTVGEAMTAVSLQIKAHRLTVRSQAVALGWLADSQTFTPLPDGEFVTDDIVEMREGELALIGRESDLINTAGKKVNPREVEGVIMQIEGVRQARVYGERAGARGEVVAAVVVATAGVTREQVRAFCRDRLSLHKVPRIVKLTDSMPLDERGKVKRAALAAL